MTNPLEAAARAMCIQGGFDPDEIMPNDGPRWRYYLPGLVPAIAAWARNVVVSAKMESIGLLITEGYPIMSSIYHEEIEAAFKAMLTQAAFELEQDNG